MCDYPAREAAMVTVREGVWCDPCLAPLVAALNDAGLSTVASCCGHGHRPGMVALADGRELVIDHIRKELAEIEADPSDLEEWVDVIILAFDGAWRAGWEPQQIIDAIKAKQAKNEAREWPDWRTQSDGKAIEHTPATLLDAIRKVMADAGEPITAVAVLDAIHHRWPGAFPLASWLDVHDEMTAFYGAPS